jgi:glycosyltransferase involved in cell wall biosynthesis
MRVLWLSMSPSLYKNTDKGYNGIGWIASLEQHLRIIQDLSLAIAFYQNENEFKVLRDNVSYYPIKRSTSIVERIRRIRISNKSDNHDMLEIISIIDDFHPEIIHVFGSETNFGKISEYTDIPVVIHIQGILNPYINAWFPAGFSEIDFLIFNGLNLKKSVKDIWMYKANKKMAKRELEILKNCKYFMGRTEWDRNVTRLLSPHSKYYYCSEVLRPTFYENDISWDKCVRNKIIIQSTISNPLYKGIDLILKTAKLLFSESKIKFEWQVFGVKDISLVERILGIKSNEVNVKLMGIATAQELKNSLLNSDVYVHPSYIDNSPNSVCEAQILGIPTIVTNVGGLSSLVEHSETGFIIPANDPYQMAFYIIQLYTNKEISIKIGTKARKVALERHDPNRVVSNLISSYLKIINEVSSLHI